MRHGSEVTETPVGSGEPAIAVEDLSVAYRVRRERPTFGSVFRSLVTRDGRVEPVHALRGVSLSVSRGSVLGVIGRNGAGKSTLLRAMAGIVPPAAGRITVRGDVTPLFRVGVGFNVRLTGRQNILLGALAAGLGEPEAREKIGDILAFAELGAFIDHPVRSYSSGMKSRLGFAVAAHLDPEILLIDETLAAGDGAFKDKCRARMEEMCNEGRTVVIVSHGMRTILEMTSECLWLHEGRVMQHGSPQEVVEAYMRFLRIRRSAILDDDDDVLDDDDEVGGVSAG